MNKPEPPTPKPAAGSRVAVAMSGGVDSSVVAAQLLAAGHQVVGVTLRLQECQEAAASRSCCGADGIARARAVAGQLGIPHYVVDCFDAFNQQVLRPAWDDYAAGRTPSPCLRCNERIKFGLLLDWSRKMGAVALATGHYARLETAPDGTTWLLRGVDRDKDQSYFLAGLTPAQLCFLRFPLGHLRKPEVRELANRLDLPSAAAPDSQDACLVAPGQCFAEMLRQRFAAPATPGLVVDAKGQPVGRHDGLHLFTIGQRKGLPGQSTSRRWVKALQADDATVVITDQESDLEQTDLVATDLNWLDDSLGLATRRCLVQVRYRHAAEAAQVERLDDTTVAVHFDHPVRAITPGQAAVFYLGERVLGRGWIRA